MKKKYIFYPKPTQKPKSVMRHYGSPNIPRALELGCSLNFGSKMFRASRELSADIEDRQAVTNDHQHGTSAKYTSQERNQWTQNGKGGE